jgi:3-oxoacyl-[acyl-carrier-protein] synthase II
VAEALRSGRSGIVQHPEWASCEGLVTRLGADVPDLSPDAIPRKAARTMGRVSVLATVATQQALDDAGLVAADLHSGRVGLAYGSTHGSTSAMETFCRQLYGGGGLMGLGASAYLKFMSHTCAANLAQHFSFRGRVLPTCSACTSASQAIGAGYEAVRYGLQDIMVCGGAEEMHLLHAAVFDLMYATSTRYSDRPHETPRPFDVARDGLVVGEGAGTLVLETLEGARARGARIHGEVLGYGTNCDGTHVTSPSAEGMRGAIERALADARLAPSEVDYVNAHGTATELGDIAESHATHGVFGPDIAISSTKGATGHTLGACGAIEAIFCLVMLRDGFLVPTRNLTEVDPRCAPLDYVRALRETRPTTIMSNNFAFGGINTSLVLKRV